MRKTRYKLQKGLEIVGESSSIEGLAKIIGCTKAHIYQRIKNGQFSHKKITYTVIDKLD